MTQRKIVAKIWPFKQNMGFNVDVNVIYVSKYVLLPKETKQTTHPTSQKKEIH